MKEFFDKYNGSSMIWTVSFSIFFHRTANQARMKEPNMETSIRFGLQKQIESSLPPFRAVLR